jgi:hypothetical protein
MGPWNAVHQTFDMTFNICLTSPLLLKHAYWTPHAGLCALQNWLLLPKRNKVWLLPCPCPSRLTFCPNLFHSTCNKILALWGYGAEQPPSRRICAHEYPHHNQKSRNSFVRAGFSFFSPLRVHVFGNWNPSARYPVRANRIYPACVV